MIKYEDVEQKIITIRNQKVILDSDVAALYGVETKDINRAVKNNPDKFLEGYIFTFTANEKNELVKNFHRFNNLKHATVKPKAFTERGLYMLATILKSSKATQTTLVIIDTFAKVREVSQIMNQLPEVKIKKGSAEQQALMHRAGDIISDLVVPDNLETDETDASIELNFAVVKFKYSVKKKAKK